MQVVALPAAFSPRVPDGGIVSKPLVGVTPLNASPSITAPSTLAGTVCPSSPLSASSVPCGCSSRSPSLQDTCDALCIRSRCFRFRHQIALVDRGGTSFADKARAAQRLGALAIVVVQNCDVWPYTMVDSATNGAGVTIPVCMVRKEHGTRCVAEPPSPSRRVLPSLLVSSSFAMRPLPSMPVIPSTASVLVVVRVMSLAEHVCLWCYVPCAV
jgi:hypothetical protein